MTITNGYCTLVELKAWLDIGDTADDSQLEVTIEAASRWIDAQTGRRFFTEADTRYYTATNPHYLYLDDVYRVDNAPSSFALTTDDNADGTYETTWATSDYILKPVNGSPFDAAGAKAPYTSLEVNIHAGDYSLPVNVQNGVKIVADFGYSETTPQNIKAACLMTSARLWKRKGAIFGIAGTAQLGVQAVQAVIAKELDIMGLLQPYRKLFYE
jgi:hypothetical protein